MLEFLKQKKKIIIIVLIILVVVVCYMLNSNDEEFIDPEEILDNSAKKSSVTDGSENDTTNQNDENSQENMIYIHIAGAVKSPGVINIMEGSRIEDAINVAGGLSEDADITNVNLAYVLKDGMKIKIPSIYDEDESEYVTMESGNNVVVDLGSSDSSSNQNNIININKASQTELETLSGIGPSLAAKIISYREENGNFKSIEDIKNVSGIGDRKFASIKDFITVK